MNFAEILQTVASLSIPPLVVFLCKYLFNLAGLKLTQKNEADIKFAAEQAVLSAAERLRHAVIDSGEKKQAMAIHVAESLRPKAFGKLEPEVKAAVIDATYRRLRPSLQTPDSPVSSTPPPADVQ